MTLPGWFVKLASVVLSVIGLVAVGATGWAIDVSGRLVRIEEKVAASFDMQNRELDALGRRVERLEHRLESMLIDRMPGANVVRPGASSP